MEITAIKSWLLRPTHLTIGHCPSKQDHKSQGCCINEVREQKDRGGCLSLQKLHDKATKAGPSKSSSHYQIKHPQWPLLAMISLCVWWEFSAPNQSSHCENHSLALSKPEHCHKMRVMARKTHSTPSSQKNSSGSGITTMNGLWMPAREARAKSQPF